MEGFSPLHDVVQGLDHVRQLSLDKLGPLAPIVTAVGQLIAAAIAIVVLFSGKSAWAPPTPGLPNFAVRLCGLAAGVGVVVLYVWSKNGGTALNFLMVAVYCLVAGLAAALIYLVARLSLCFQCEQDPAVYVRGLRLAPNARRVLNNDLVGLPPQYDLRGQPAPANAAEYFCKSGKTPEFVWLRMSHVVAVVLLFLSYFLAMVPITIGLAGAAIALTQPQLEVTQTAREAAIELPADILFDFDSAEVRPRAESSLESAAEILRKRSVAAATIEGHTDSRGTAQYNLKLSEQRAGAVRNWLLQRGGLNTAFAIRGLGASKPVEANTKADGSDSPEGRQRNRRVVIVFDRR